MGPNKEGKKASTDAAISWFPPKQEPLIACRQALAVGPGESSLVIVGLTFSLWAQRRELSDGRHPSLSSFFLKEASLSCGHYLRHTLLFFLLFLQERILTMQEKVKRKKCCPQDAHRTLLKEEERDVGPSAAADPACTQGRRTGFYGQKEEGTAVEALPCSSSLSVCRRIRAQSRKGYGRTLQRTFRRP